MFRVMLILAGLIVYSLVSADDGNNGIPDRVSALEEMSLQQQELIDQNASNISELKSWVALDANGNSVGEFMGFEGYYALAKMEFGDYEGTVRLTKGGVRDSAYLVYPGVNCTGPVYVWKHQQSQWFEDFVLAYSRGGPTGTLLPYRLNGAYYSNVYYRSYVGGDGVCRNSNRSGVSLHGIYPVPLDVTSLRETYPAPIEIVKR